jgi:hypothetical protein
VCRPLGTEGLLGLSLWLLDDQNTISDLLQNKFLLAFLYRWPGLVAFHRESIVNMISDPSGSRQELIITLCWVVGEFVSSQIIGPLATVCRSQ